MEIAPFDPGRDVPHAVVREEDVQLVLAADPVVPPPHQSLRTLEAAAMAAPAHRPGTVVVRPGRPLRLLAVIHDLDREPSWSEAWIADALDGVFRESRWRGLTGIATPLLGTVHGRLPVPRATELLAAALQRAADTCPDTLWLEDAPGDVLACLRRRFARATDR